MYQSTLQDFLPYFNISHRWHLNHYAYFSQLQKNHPSCRYCTTHSVLPKPFSKHFIAPRLGHVTFSGQELNYVGLFFRKMIMIYSKNSFFGNTYSFHFL